MSGSPYIDNFNQTIENKIRETISQGSEDSTDDYCFPSFIAYDYDFYVNGNILSLVLKLNHYYSEGYVNYEVYNFDLKTGDAVTSSQILSKKGMTENELQSKLETQISLYFADNEDNLSQTIEYVKQDSKLDIYLNADNNIVVLVEKNYENVLQEYNHHLYEIKE